MVLGMAVTMISQPFKKAPLTTNTQGRGEKIMILQKLTVFTDKPTLVSNIEKTVWSYKTAMTVIYIEKKKIFVTVS